MDHFFMIFTTASAATILLATIKATPPVEKYPIIARKIALSIGVPIADDNKMRCFTGFFV